MAPCWLIFGNCRMERRRPKRRVMRRRRMKRRKQKRKKVQMTIIIRLVPWNFMHCGFIRCRKMGVKCSWFWQNCVMHVYSFTSANMKWLDQWCIISLSCILSNSLTPMVLLRRISSSMMTMMTGTKRRKPVSFHLMFNSYYCYATSFSLWISAVCIVKLANKNNYFHVTDEDCYDWWSLAAEKVNPFNIC